MNEKQIQTVAIIVFFIGMMIIIVEANNVQTQTIEINKINESMVGKNVKVKGYVDKMLTKENLMFFDLKENGKIKVVVFAKNFVELFEGDYVEVEGKVVLYNNILEINANVVKDLS